MIIVFIETRTNPAPVLCEGEGEGGVEPHGEERHGRVLQPALYSQHRGHDGQLQDGRDNIKHQGREDEADGAGAPVYRLGEGAGLSVQVEAQVELVEVEEHILGDVTDTVLGHSGKHGVPEYTLVP